MGAECFFTVLLVLYEVIFHIARFGLTADFVLNKIFAVVILGFSLGMLIDLLPVKAARIISCIITACVTIYFLVQLIYSSVFANFWSLSATANIAGQAFDYNSTIIGGIKADIVPFFLYIILMMAGIIYIIKLLLFKRHLLSTYLVSIGGVATAVLYFIILLSLQGDDKNSPLLVFKNYSSVEMSIQKLGVTETMLRDGLYMLQSGDAEIADTGFEHEVYVPSDDRLEGTEDIDITEASDTSEIANGTGTEAAGADNHDNESKSDGDADTERNENTDKNETSEESTAEAIEEATDELKLYTAQTLDINLSDIDQLAASSPSVQELNHYINSIYPTYTNDYTGMFEGYNLILITAEGFDGFVIDKNKTPTLYKMSHEGFVFENFYTPLWYGSTLGGEYANLTGLMPKSGSYLSMQKVGSSQNSMPFTLGNELLKKGYNNFAYHNNGFTYYDRHISRKYIGYEYFLGVGNGLPYEKNSKGGVMWPQSDLFMEQNTFDEYADTEPFHVYYMTVSGHLEYNFNGNAMSARNRDAVEELPYSEKTRAYIACQLEFEKMLTQLNRDLEGKGIADRTLIVICGDHVPYDDMDIPGELSGTYLDNTFECYRNSLIIYSTTMEKPVKVKKVCYSLDILPTVLNLMGLPFDSRMLVGRDIMSDELGLVIMSDSSFITDDYKYDASTGTVTKKTSRKISDTELENMKSVVANRFRMADAICELDYYKYVEMLMED